MKSTKSSTAIGSGPEFEPPAKKMLEDLYRLYNSRRWVHPDPLEFLYRYENPEDREVVGFIASSLAYGRVAQILVSVDRVLNALGRRPSRFLDQSLPKHLISRFNAFVHRFTTGEDLASMLVGLKRVRERFGSLQNCFLSGYSRSDDTVVPALKLLISEIGVTSNGLCSRNSLLSPPDKGSACKRHHLFLRWMVRRDSVDPGDWDAVSPSKLIVPLDTHMYRICSSWGFTKRKAPGGATAYEITRAFREITPGDPVRYDFAITRLGIRKDLDTQSLLCGR
jgi:uncharacterized protein (TIGR02757 family)